jgi:hypothetical protein
MKKIVFGATLLAIISILVACSKTSTTSGTSDTSTALSPQAKLLVGTFKLENTSEAITAEQAKSLLPLWRTLQALTSSSTAATEEVNAVVDQITSIMTTAQMDKITSMKLTRQDMMSIMSQAGVPANGASTTITPMARNGIPSGGGSQGSGGPGGGASGPPAGGMPPGGDFPGAGGPGSNTGQGGASTTPQAPRADANQVPPPLLNALIELLQKKIQ